MLITSLILTQIMMTALYQKSVKKTINGKAINTNTKNNHILCYNNKNKQKYKDKKNKK